jgi:hypothetical protein
MIIYVDIDDTICYTPKANKPSEYDYSKAVPILKNIEKVNILYDEGHTIIYWTARGALSGKNWFELTQNQLKEWGAKYHELKCNKPFYDLFIDDKAITTLDEVFKHVKKIG